MSIIPYSGKLSRDKTFANFADLEPFVKVFSANFEGRKCTCAHASHPTVDPRKFSPRNLLLSHFRESFIPRKFPAIRYKNIMIISIIIIYYTRIGKGTQSCECSKIVYNYVS